MNSLSNNNLTLSSFAQNHFFNNTTKEVPLIAGRLLTDKYWIENKSGKKIAQEQGNISIETSSSYLQREFTNTETDIIQANVASYVPFFIGEDIYKLYSPEVDCFEWQDHSNFNENNFFSNLISFFPIPNSVLISHFIECEKNNQPYTDPQHSNQILIKKRRVTYDKRKGESPENFNGLIFYINGGSETIKYILEFYPEFVPYLYHIHFCNEEYLEKHNIKIKITRFDLCVKSTQNVMPLISHFLSRGHVWSGGAHLFGLGYFQNKPFSAPVGRQSIKYKKEIQHAPWALDVETLYVGSDKLPSRFIIYNKEKRTLLKDKKFSIYKTHYELRFNCLKYPVSLDFFNKLFIDYFSNGSLYFRTNLFLEQLKEQVCLVTKQREQPNKNTYMATAAPCWIDSIISPLQDMLDMFLTEAANELRDEENIFRFDALTNPIYYDLLKHLHENKYSLIQLHTFISFPNESFFGLKCDLKNYAEMQYRKFESRYELLTNQFSLNRISDLFLKWKDIYEKIATGKKRNTLSLNEVLCQQPYISRAHWKNNFLSLQRYESNLFGKTYLPCFSFCN